MPADLVEETEEEDAEGHEEEEGGGRDDAVEDGHPSDVGSGGAAEGGAGGAGGGGGGVGGGNAGGGGDDGLGEVEVEVTCFERERASQMSLAFPGDRDGGKIGDGEKGTYRVAGAAGWSRMGYLRAWCSLSQWRSSMVRRLI